MTTFLVFNRWQVTHSFEQPREHMGAISGEFSAMGESVSLQYRVKAYEL